MKKLLAIAVATAVAAPMAAMADTTVYGKLHVSYGKTKSNDENNLQNHASRIGFKGSNAMDNGLAITHKLETLIGGFNKPNNGSNDNLIGSARNVWVGVKGGFGEVRFGTHDSPYDSITNGSTTDIMNQGVDYEGGQDAGSSITYINKFGNIGVQAQIDNNDGTNDAGFGLAVNYAAGPLYAGLGYGNEDSSDEKGTILGLGYKGANWQVGLTHAMPDEDDSDGTTLAGRYKFGKAFVQGQYVNREEGEAGHALELGYTLGKATAVYIQTNEASTGTKGTEGAKRTSVGLTHWF